MNRLTQYGIVLIPAAIIAGIVTKHVFRLTDRAQMLGAGIAQVTALVTGVVLIVVGLVRSRRQR